MPLSTDVALPLSWAADVTWPDRCVRCGAAGPDSVFRFRAARVGWLQILTLGTWGSLVGRPPVTAPACRGCARRLRRDRLVRGLCSWAVLLPLGVATLLVLDRLGLYGSPYRKLVGGAALAVVFLPVVLLEMWRPPAVDATAMGRVWGGEGTISFEFRDPAYAMEFQRANAVMMRLE